MIDYYSRFGVVYHIKDRTTKEVLKGFKKFIKHYGFPKKIIHDNAKEFLCKEYTDYLNQNDIHQHTTVPYKHESNGRIERFNKTIREIMLKQEGGYLDKIENAIICYNNSWHSGINAKPIDVFFGRIEKNHYNMNLEKNKKKFKKIKEEEKYEINDTVYFKDNRIERNKTEPKFVGPGKIIACKENDVYEIEFESKIYEMHASMMKGFKKGGCCGL